MSRCPATSWAMCGGMPCRTASVMNMRRKSCGVNRSGCPAASVRPVPSSASVEPVADGVGGDGAVLDAEPALEQQRHRRVPDPFVGVVGGDAAERRRRGRGSGVMIAARTSASSGLMTSSRSVSVLDGAICSSGTSSPVPGRVYWIRLWWRQLGEFLDADPGVPQRLHRRPGPERPVLLAGQVAALPGVAGLRPRSGRSAPRSDWRRGAVLRRRR